MVKRNKAILELEQSAKEFMESVNAEEVAPLISSEVEFSHIQLKDIIITEQVRSKEQMDNESLKDIIDSITEKGVLQPIIVYRAPNDTRKYVLLAGERRYMASKASNKPHIPARIFPKKPSETEIIEIQLIENLQRKDLNPADEAKGYVNYYALCHKKKEPDLDSMINDLFTYTTRPEKVKKESALIISAIEKISGKSIGYIRKLVQLLRLPEEALNALKNGSLGITQAIVFSENINNPHFNDILERAIKNKMTVKAIEGAFKNKGVKKTSVAFYKKRISQLRNDVQKNMGNISTSFAAQLLAETEDLLKTLKEIIKKKT